VISKLRLIAPALSELDEAIAWYAAQSPGLDQRFLEEVSAAKDHILAHPHAWHPLGNGVRRFRLRRFPYGIIYVAEGSEIVVLAVAHLHREPTYWRSRLQR
jgi:plasmid stabilization system protein ParE